MVRPRLHAAALERERRADEDRQRARRDEAVDEILREPQIDLRGRPRRALLAILAREVHVGVQPVLVRDVAERPEPPPEVTAVRA